MTDHKFTDDDVIKALECCSPIISEDFDCDICPYNEKGCNTKLVRDALALINRQKAEIESLQAVHADMTESLRLATEANKDMQARIERLIKANNRDDLQHKYCNLIGDVLVYSKSLEDYNKFRKSFKSKAIKEFAERLKKKYFGRYECSHDYIRSIIDALVKEMTEK